MEKTGHAHSRRSLRGVVLERRRPARLGGVVRFGRGGGEEEVATRGSDLRPVASGGEGGGRQTSGSAGEWGEKLRLEGEMMHYICELWAEPNSKFQIPI